MKKLILAVALVVASAAPVMAGLARLRAQADSGYPQGASHHRKHRLYSHWLLGIRERAAHLTDVRAANLASHRTSDQPAKP